MFRNKIIQFGRLRFLVYDIVPI